MTDNNNLPADFAAGTTIVYLVRHGQTASNVERRIQGHLDVPLSATGLEQAGAVATWLSRRPHAFAALYSSDLLRAAQTTWAIAGALGLEPYYTRCLREIDMGEWQGKLVSEIEAMYPGALRRWHERIDVDAPPGGEGLAQVRARLAAFYAWAVQKHSGKAIIFVSHGAALAALVAATQGWGLAETWSTGRARMGNTGVTVIAENGGTGEHRILLLNSSEHLAEPTGISSVLDPRVDVHAP